MVLLKNILILLCIILAQNANCWFFSGKTDGKLSQSQIASHEVADGSGQPLQNAQQQVFRQVPFEIKLVDDRLLKEISAVDEMSLLDSCYHRVMAELQGSCGLMNEEEISKLSVQLLNCQSSVEGRQTFLCTSDMSIGECTKEMDSTLWNSYQIVSNRARAVCYQIRQQQFRFKTELTVNKLVQTSEEQLRNMREMESSQEVLRNMTEDAMKNVMVGQERLLNQQDEISTTQMKIESQIETNLKQLELEKIIITSENEKIMKMTEQIHDKLDDTNSWLSKQADAQSQMYNELMHDVNQIFTETQSVFKVLDEGRSQLNMLKDETTEHLDDVVQNLKLINGSINYVVRMIESAKLVVFEHLQTIEVYLKLAGKDLDFLSTFAFHVIYFFLVLFALTFFHLHPFFKVLLLLLVLANVASLAYLEVCLSFANLTYVLVFLILFHYLMVDKCSSKVERESAKQSQGFNSTLALPNNDIARKITGSGLSLPEIQKVIQVLEKLKCERNNAEEIEMNSSPKCGSSVNSSSSNHEAFFNDDVQISSDPFSQEVILGGSFLPMNPPPTPNHFPNLPLEDCKVDRNLRTPLTARRHLMMSFEHLTPTRRTSRSSSPARMSTPRHKSPSRDSTFNRSLRPQCTASTKSGTTCKLPCQDGSFYCHVHLNSPALDSF
ncbi:hypothetical protein HELRODRAFT_190484 [Helobdella robusta]|uniref:Protein brambleberry n=1 Tax=Helobdella robusta TaxID=6412 RepID=T1FS11_HELRO|nr:hypothetical protein HELRODRAFT_190484 [Helobdella robusta]ESO09402.1 hypothetical protein HELRODRAFT_190484 [Helobdella robusta]